MHYDVVIAGGGFAGAYCARNLGQALGRAEGERRVALIAERNVLVFQPMLAEVVGSSLDAVDVVNPLRQFCRDVSVYQGLIQRIDWEKKQVLVDGGRFTRNRHVGFTHLVLALGNVTDLSAVPGMAEYAWPMKNAADALRLRSALINRLEEANLVEEAAVRARLLTFVVVGGGYTGVETAGQLNDFVREAKRFYGNLRDVPPRVVLVHGREQLLPESSPELGAHALQVLERNGVEVRLSTRVAEVTASRVQFASGAPLEAHTIVSTIGSAPSLVTLDLCRQLGIEPQRGRVPTTPEMRVAGHDTLWAVGDGAAVPWEVDGETKVSPPTAQFATRQGAQLGRSLARVLRGGEPQPFRHRYLGQLAAIGRREAVAEVFGLHFRGFIAWWMWRSIYLAKLPGTLRKLRVMMDWSFDLVFPRDISVVLPPPDEVMRAIHLEAGEPLFAPGDKCRSIFYVRRGALTLTTEGQAPMAFPQGSVIDPVEFSRDGFWTAHLSAAERSDVVAFRGRAFELLKNELRLVSRA